MDKQTLSNYGWIVIAVMVLVVMIALATPFGKFVSGAVKTSTQGLFDVSKKALESTELMQIPDQKFDTETTTGLKTYLMLEAPTDAVNATEKVVFRSEADRDKFVEVRVDDTVVDSANYYVREGSTVIEFKPGYLKTLENGDHTVEVVSNDGLATSDFAIKPLTFGATFTDGTFLTWEELQNKYSVTETSINREAFETNGTIADIVIPEGVTSIGRNAFDGCPALTSVTIPSSVTQILSSAFENCRALVSIKFNGTKAQWNNIALGTNWKAYVPAAVVNCSDGDVVIGAGATFSDGTYLTWSELQLAENGRKYEYLYEKISDTTLDTNAFKGCASLVSISIPDGITKIGSYAFKNCTSLEDVKMPNGVTNFGQDVFVNCTSLRSIELPGSLTSITNNSFVDCTKLTKVTIHASVKAILPHAFANCTSLTDIIFEGTQEQWATITLGVNWNDGVPTKTVKCYNGNVTIQ